MQLPVRKVFQEAVAYEPGHILPIVVSFVSQFFLQHGPDRDHRRKRIPEEEELQTQCPVQHAKACCQYNCRNATQFDDRSQKFEQPQVRKRQPSDPSIARPEQHVLVRPQHIQQTLVPASALSPERSQVRRHLRPANRVRDKLDAVVRAFSHQVAVQARHQVEIFANCVRSIPPHSKHQIGSENSESAGNNRQHVSPSPCLSSNQESTQIFNHLDDFDALPRQAHPAHTPTFDLRAVQHPHNSAHRYDALRVCQYRHHDSQQRISLEHRVRVDHAHIWRGRRIQTCIYCIRLTPCRFLIHDKKPCVDVASVQPPDRSARHLRNVHRSHQTQSKLLLHHLQGAIIRPVIYRSEEHTSELQSHSDLVCRLLL